MEPVRIGDCELWLGDCMSILPSLGKVDAVITDPPYGLGDKWRGGTKEWRLADNGNGMAWDLKPFPDLMTVVGMAPRVIIWGGHLYSLPLSRGWLIWDKCTRGFSSGDCEIAWTTLDQPVRALSIGTNIFTPVMPGWEEKLHPTQKPVAVMEWCLTFLPDARTILDPFMGSGTTGVACAKLGRKFIGIEIEPRYFDIACKRIEDAYKQPDFFVDPPKKAVQEPML